MKEERRFSEKIEARAAEDGSRCIEGIAAVIDSPTIIYDGEKRYKEVIRKGAFDKALNGDIMILKNHRSDLILGRSKNGKGTGRVYLDERGNLAFSVPVRENRSHSVDTHDEILSGDLDGCSFSFFSNREKEKWTWPENRQEDLPTREIFEVRIKDVGPVTYPAYPETSVQARSLEEAEKEHKPPKPNLLTNRKKLFKNKYSN